MWNCDRAGKVLKPKPTRKIKVPLLILRADCKTNILVCLYESKRSTENSYAHLIKNFSSEVSACRYSFRAVPTLPDRAAFRGFNFHERVLADFHSVLLVDV